MGRILELLITAAVVTHTVADDFNVLRHLGGNGQWFPGSEVTGISKEVPEGCKVDMVGFFSRHGSRYPDQGAYDQWLALQKHVQESPFTVNDSRLEFLKTWKPALSNPTAQIAQISPTGYKELTEMGATLRLRYPDLYAYNTPFTMWSNWYNSSPRVRDSARMFAHGFLGPNATELGTIYALNSSDPTSWMNSLAPSDLCPAYKDEGGSPYIDEWQSAYLPPIVSRLNAKFDGNFSLTEQEVTIIPYLCGFETQITGKRSPFCDIFNQDEILQYEYAQDLRYWYGTGLGSDIEKLQMLPTLDMLTKRFADGPDATYSLRNSTFQPPNIMASFSNDGQINQLVAASGVFDNEPQLPGNMTLPNRKFRASRLTPMRGTITFERLVCSTRGKPQGSPSGYALASSSSYPGPSTIQTLDTITRSTASSVSTSTSRVEAAQSTASGVATPTTNCNNTQKRDVGLERTSNVYLRVLLNDVVYPVANCDSGPGSSCLLSRYQQLVEKKLAKAGDFTNLCNTTNATFAKKPQSTFFMDNTLPFMNILHP